MVSGKIMRGSFFTSFQPLRGSGVHSRFKAGGLVRSTKRCLCAQWVAGVLSVIIIGASAPAGAAPPANDDYANTTELIGGSGFVYPDNNDATKEPGEPDHAGNVGGNSVWYRWTAPQEGTANFDTRYTYGPGTLPGPSAGCKSTLRAARETATGRFASEVT